ncbi:peptide chain release factor N(5)-glutamine methyltransferase [Conexibacter arvalis]|uniref:Release factor glutamine methyltransferase n=1 Tax=Conexibacter arvalis TaxID=912552 RepID=A0A840IKE0_9ACTN|nr:peptide chain release factor N(5)-glutamine methyltransferase [Conexibacter arvalis]MBB4664398.1 release factor glutamine methyltransferase [Conexibacter arvalis]
MRSGVDSSSRQRPEAGAAAPAGDATAASPGTGSAPDPEGWAFADGPSVRMSLAIATADLREAGCDNPRLDAELLLADALRATRTSLHLHPERILAADESARFAAAVARRRAREPVAYIRGTRGFRHIDLIVDRRVLVPRPETELLVEVALRLPRGARVADVGTGSGAVALALKHERPDLQVVATDVSADALAVARANAEALRLDVAFVQGDLLDAVAGPLDAVLSNPPYVPDGDRDGLEPEVAVHEPALALFAGGDGLDVLRRLARAAAARAPFVAFELGQGQAGAVAELLREAGMSTVAAHRDLAGIERVVVGER